MEENKKESSNKGLVILLCALVVVIAGLGVGIVIMSGTYRESESSEVSSEGAHGGSLQALSIDEEITDKLDEDEGYSIEDAIEEYEYETSFGDTEKRVYLLFNYANFIYDVYDDINRAVEIMKRVEPLLDSNSMTSDYYIAMATLYGRAGYDEQEALYNQKVIDITPKVKVDENGQKDVEKVIVEEIDR